MGPFGVQEMMVILLLALLLFGPKKLPELARLLGKGLSEFRRAKNELKNTFDTHMQELEREARLEEAKKNAAAAPASTPYTPYSYVADEYGKRSAEYGYNGSESTYPSEPAVESHAVYGAEAPALPPANGVPGTVPRSTESADSIGTGAEEHPA